MGFQWKKWLSRSLLTALNRKNDIFVAIQSFDSDKDIILKTIHVTYLSALPAAAQELLETTKGYRVFLFFAEMGMGKTTLIKELCKQLGVKDNVSSPSFSIVNEYKGPEESIYHFDFYRLKDEQEAYDLGYEEYFYSGKYCFVEWPEKIENLLPENAVSIYINGKENGERNILLQFAVEN